jgi:LysM repeat protein
MYFGDSMRANLILIFLFFLVVSGSSQDLNILQEGGKLYLNHKVAPKENWYSIGRVYNTSPKEIAPFNNTSLEKGLAIGQQIRIPLNANNFAQSGQPGVDEVFVPLYHKVKEKEGLYRVSQIYNKVSPELLKSWNKLKSDEISVGSELVVGFLRVKQDLSPLAAKGQQQISGESQAKQAKPEGAKETAPAKPVNAPATEKGNNATSKTVSPPAPVSNSKPGQATQPPATTNNPKTTPVQEGPGTEGVFASLYADQTKGNPGTKIGGQGATFKSTSGWKDGKYYVLMNKVAPGTIIKITLPSTNKVVYAKVLGEIPPGTENEGLLIRISNSASAQLQAPDGRFEVQLQY